MPAIRGAGKIRIGIIGCGAIGSRLAAYCAGDLKGKIDIAALYDRDKKRLDEACRAFAPGAGVESAGELIEKSDFIAEAASSAVSADIAEAAVSKGKSVLIMSVGGLVGREDIFSLAAEKNAGIYVPSGALCGIDGLKAMAVGKIQSVTLTTRKPPKGLEGAPYVTKNKIDLDSIKGEKVIFEGSAEEALQGFPANVNVSAVLSLAGVGAKRTRVRIIASPSYTKNIHEVEIVGDAGKITTRSENVPSPDNPKTSFLAVLSAQAVLKKLTEPVYIGT